MRFSKAVVRGRVAILILTVLLMIPAVFGMLGTGRSAAPGAVLLF